MTHQEPPVRRQAALTVAAMGVVFGDIGTSPLYALRECFVGVSGFPVDHANVLGVLSLIVWSLVVVVSINFIGLVLRADNQGEGGLLALAHLVVPADMETWSRAHWALAGLGLFGAALLFGDGIITPALSVLSAVEGLAVATPSFEPVVVPLTMGILIGLFAIQRFGTGRVGALFGPVMLVWFTTLALLGVARIVEHPMVLIALDPRHAVSFFVAHGPHGALILGAVFLAVTGAEAMYADLGHFGRRPIQRAWVALVFPALLVNYFGQGALLLQHPELVDEVFYRLAPTWALYPVVILATLATIIASQAVISGVFSLTAQAVQLQYLPRTVIRHTSAAHRGQLYVPAANVMLLGGTLLLVLGFRSSGALADAYGIAVSLTMVLTVVLMFFVMRDRWGWSWPLAAAVTAIFLTIDLVFFFAIARKFLSGGWIPLSIAVVMTALMVLWRRGRHLRTRAPIQLTQDLLPEGPCIILMRSPEQVRLADCVERSAVLVHVDQCHRPHMRGMSHGEVRERDGRQAVHACFGFMEQPDLPALLLQLRRAGEIELDPAAKYVLVHETLPAPQGSGRSAWAAWVYRWLEGRAASAAESLGLPAERVVTVHPVASPR
ncbi:MAG: KUP/HAK/KT family potassium transporter [Alphaproteobacteria bacterium]|nr:KUP/HAK/KT family potassium transporter [Alphaproteobacteria bacterium]